MLNPGRALWLSRSFSKNNILLEKRLFEKNGYNYKIKGRIRADKH